MFYDTSYEDHLYDGSHSENENIAADNFQSHFTNLHNLLEKEDYAEIIRASFVVNKKEILLAILTFVSHFSLPMDAAVYCCKMINSFFSFSVIPDTLYFIDKLFYPKEGTEYHAVCPECKSYVNRFTKKQRYIVCSICKVNIDLKSPSFRDYFAVMDVRMEIKKLD